MQKILSRDISWLHFNGRVLQEAEDGNNPLYERLKFLAIYSSNLDEFYRVRIPYLRNFSLLKKENVIKDSLKPKKVWKEVQRIIDSQQKKLGDILVNDILPALADKKVFIQAPNQFTEAQHQYALDFFDQKLKKIIHVNMIEKGASIPFLKNRGIYLVVWFEDIIDKAGFIEIPIEEISRWVTLPATDSQSHYFAYVDDIIRINIEKLFPNQNIQGVYSIKLTRDAELYIQDELDGDLADKIINSVNNRDKQAASRCLYDMDMPELCIKLIRKTYGLSKQDMVLGGRYHNLTDFFSLPKIESLPELVEEDMPPLPHPKLHGLSSIMDYIAQNDVLISVPYQSFEYITQLIHEAANSDDVEEIKITLYRVSSQSEIAKALEKACQNGKKVTAFIEVKARFDEESNYYWGSRLKEAGAQILFSIADIKVHSKILLIKVKSDSERQHCAYLGTGNFNEKTAKLYTDNALLTSDPAISETIDQVFNLLERKIIMPKVGELMVSPFNTRTTLMNLIDDEIAKVKNNKKGSIILKMNSLEDLDMIYKLYEASLAGVKITCIVRGICCLIPGIPGLSENIEVRSIVDRFLEHTRVYIFGVGVQQKIYLASADWMTRNLDRRVEVCFPIKNKNLKDIIKTLIEYQLKDNVKARLINEEGDNAYYKNNKAAFRSQIEIYQFFKRRAESIDI